MNEVLQQKLKELPEKPGIYQMLDKKGNIIYIGKSKCLKKRVHSYFVPSPVWEKAKEMANFIEDIEIIVTDTHLEAMLLECERIKNITPYFNSMMKNDKKYSYLTLEENYRRNPLKVTGSREEISFGPFRSRGQLLDAIEVMRNLYPITRNCGWYQFEYHIFPCEMEKEVFQANRKVLAKMFSGKNAMPRFLYAVEQKMKQAAAEQKFERASQFRDLHIRMKWLQKSLNRLEEWKGTEIIYAVPLETGYKLFYIRDKNVVYSEKTEENTPEIRRAFAETARAHKKDKLCALSEKELLDYQDIVCAELSGAPENVYPI